MSSSRFCPDSASQTACKCDFDQVAVCEFERRWADDAADHLLRFGEVVLVVRALRRAVGDHQGGLTGTAGSSGTLGIVGRRRRHVSQIDRVQRRDVDAQLHRRRAEECRQENVWLSLIPETLLVRFELLTILVVPNGSAIRATRGAPAPLAPCVRGSPSRRVPRLPRQEPLIALRRD